MIEEISPARITLGRVKNHIRPSVKKSPSIPVKAKMENSSHLLLIERLWNTQKMLKIYFDTIAEVKATAADIR